MIYIHSFGSPISEDPNIGISFYDYVRIFFSRVLGRVAVSSFFFMSGYLFFYNVGHFDKAVYLKKLKSRCSTILVPFILWNVICIAADVIPYLIKLLLVPGFEYNIVGYFNEHGWLNMFWACYSNPLRVSWFGSEIYHFSPISIPLWYLRDLIVMFLLTFVVYWLIKKINHWFIVILLFCFCSGLWPNIPGLSLTSSFFFGFGAYMAINKINAIEMFRRHNTICLIVTLILATLMVVYKGNYTIEGKMIYPFFCLFGVVTTFNIAGYVVQKWDVPRWAAYLSKSSFFIYAIHTIIILPVCTQIIHTLLPVTNVAIMIFDYMIIPLVCATVCLMLYFVLEKCAPGILGVLTENRMAKRVYS